MRTVRCGGYLTGDVCPGGVCQGGWVYPSMQWGSGADTSPLPWTEFLTHACENITFP